MKNNKAHLDIDLEFLGGKDRPKAQLSKAAPKHEKRSCQQCGAKVEEDEKFCTECGVKLKKTESHPPTPKPVSTVYKYKWKNILLIGGGIFLFIVWLVAADSGGSSSSTNSTYTPPATNNEYLAGGEGQTYRCSDYNYNRALALKPAEPTPEYLAESAALDRRIAALETQSAQVDAMYVDETDQASINRYNAAVEDYNSKSNRLKLDIVIWNQKSAARDQQIDTFNNFLDTNCTPQ